MIHGIVDDAHRFGDGNLDCAEEDETQRKKETHGVADPRRRTEKSIEHTAIHRVKHLVFGKE